MTITFRHVLSFIFSFFFFINLIFFHHEECHCRFLCLKSSILKSDGAIFLILKKFGVGATRGDDKLFIRPAPFLHAAM